MAPDPTRAPASPAWTSGPLLAIGGSAIVLGGLLAVVGLASFGGPGPGGSAVPLALVVLGGVALAAGFAAGGRATFGQVRSAVPRLYPFQGASVQIGIFLLGVVSTAAVVSALFAEYTGALDGGDSAGVANPAVLNDLYLVASALLWAFAVWVIVLIAQVVRVGRWAEVVDGRNVYGRVDLDEQVRPKPPKGEPAPAPPGSQRAIVVGATVAIALAAMAGIQGTEAGGDPPPAAVWWALEALSVIWSIGVAYAFLGIDRQVRELERRWARTASPRGTAASPVPAAATTD